MVTRLDLLYRMVMLSPIKERQFTVINTTMADYLTDRLGAMSAAQRNDIIVITVNIGCPQRDESTWRIETVQRADDWLRERSPEALPAAAALHV